MAKKFRIGLVYINTNNLGDIVIFDCARYLIEQAFESNGFTDYEIVPIDMGERNAVKSKLNASFIKKQEKQHANANQYVKEWKSSKAHQYFAENEKPKIRELDVVVFGGGGLIKFHEQHFHMYIDEITTEADLYNIPVIFNAVGVEGYDDSDPRCQILKKALNRRCVSAVSTRDNLDLLQKKYLPTKNVELVCDPALWAAEAYSIHKKPSNKIIGLGVIRPEIFELYGEKVSKEKLMKFYKIIITRLEEQDIEYKLFSNGGRRDQRFIDDIKAFMGKGEEFDAKVHPVGNSGKELAETIVGFSRVLAFRMHAAVLAYAFAVPATIAMWNDKQKFFAELTDQKDNLLYAVDFDSGEKASEKILTSKVPVHSDDYKNTDRDFISKQLWHLYKRRHLTKAVASLRFLKRRYINI